MTTKAKPKTSRCPKCGAGRVELAGPALLRALRDLLAVIRTDCLVPDSVSYMQEADKAVAFAEGRGA